MPIYPDEINKIASGPRYVRDIEHSDAHATAVSFECGSFIRFELAESEGRIELAYRTNGCGFLVAAADIIAGDLSGRPLSALHGLADEELTVIVEDRVRQEFPNNRLQCLAVALEGIHAVFANLRVGRLAQNTSSDAIICTCFSVSEETIETCIATQHPKTIEEVTALCRAGSGCGSCRMLIGEMLDEAHML